MAVKAEEAAQEASPATLRIVTTVAKAARAAMAVPVETVAIWSLTVGTLRLLI